MAHPGYDQAIRFVWGKTSATIKGEYNQQLEVFEKFDWYKIKDPFDSCEGYGKTLTAALDDLYQSYKIKFSIPGDEIRPDISSYLYSLDSPNKSD